MAGGPAERDPSGKSCLRRYARRLEASARNAHGDLVQGNLRGLPEVGRARTVVIYSALPGEVPILDLLVTLGEAGARVVLPRVTETGLALHVVRPGDPLGPGFAGIAEPSPQAERVRPLEVDLFCVPGLLFDRAGNRLGRGGAHYDSLLACARDDACRVGVCWDERLVEAVPTDSWDVPMDVIVTEREVIRVAHPSRSDRGPS